MLFYSVSTLPQGAGVPAWQLRRLALKELTDNALDAGASKVKVGALDASFDRYFVQDDGPGIEPDRVARLFSANRPLVSSKHWRLPSRGAMGNGLRVVVGAVAASDGRLEVWTRDRRLILTPQPDGSTAVEVSKIDFPVGTRIEITFGEALPPELNALWWAQAAVQMAEGGETYRGKPSPHWLDAEHFWRMLRTVGNRPVREFVAELEGCSGQKAGRITAAFKGVACNAITQEQAIEILKAARAETSPVPARRLGKVGKLPTLPPWYAAEEGMLTVGGLEPYATIPFSVEAWVEAGPKGENDAAMHLFINKTPITGEITVYWKKAKLIVWGCGLAHELDLTKGSYSITVNINTPYYPITTDGKEPDLSHFAREIVTVILKAGRKARKAVAPDQTISIKDAAWEVMEEAYLKASKGGTLPANARQIMYAARTRILEMTGKPSLDDKYFTQNLLPNFLREHPELTEDWDVVFDARGHLIEPHTGRRVALGTLGVRAYLSARRTGKPESLSLSTGGVLYPTVGPRNRYRQILFVEKEGFDPLLEAAGIAAMFDIAIASTKGMSVIAIRKLLDEIQTDGPVDVYAFHDMDISGRTIFGTLTTDGWRYEFKNNITIHDLGLRYEDVVEMGLESEPFDLGKQDVAKVRQTLVRHGASKGEIDMLLRQRRRVELNSMASDQFITHLKRRLTECGVKKVVPDDETLDAAWRRTLVQRRLEEEAEKMRAQAEWEANEADVPADLADRVRKVMTDDPGLSWDRALIMDMDTAKRRR